MYQSDFDGRVALVTGGTSGIGLATARAFAEAGARVVIAGRDPERGARALGELKRVGEVHYVQADVADVEQVEAMVRFTTEAFGGLDMAVNSAGVGLPPVPFLEADPSQWQQTIAVNLTGMYHCLRAELRAMVADPARARRASIVNISSMAARISFPGIAPYCASKGGVVSLTRAVALEFAPMGIRVNVISPAVVETPMQESLPPPMREAMVNAHPVGRIGRPEEIACAARWLCSDACGFLTGHDMVIDGGYSLQ